MDNDPGWIHERRWWQHKYAAQPPALLAAQQSCPAAELHRSSSVRQSSSRLCISSCCCWYCCCTTEAGGGRVEASPCLPLPTRTLLRQAEYFVHSVADSDRSIFTVAYLQTNDRKHGRIILRPTKYMVEHFSGRQIEYCSLVFAHCGWRIIQLAAPPPPWMYCVSADGGRGGYYSARGSSGRGGDRCERYEPLLRERVRSGGPAQCRGRKVESPGLLRGPAQHTRHILH